MNEDLFIKNETGKLYEGPLSDKPIKLLIVLKEPNGDDLNCFWMREKVMNRIEGTRYYNFLGAFAKSIIGGTHYSALEHSAYINLYPYSGSSRVNGGKYVTLMKVWAKKKIGKEVDADALNEILNNRLSIIKSAIESGISVIAHYEIADMLAVDTAFEKTIDYPENNKYHITSFRYKNKAKLYAIPHPSYSIDYTYLAEKILKIPSVYPEE